jgi:hypothetical protein
MRIPAILDEGIRRHRQNAGLLRLLPGVHLDEEIRQPAGTIPFLGQRFGEARSVHGFDDVEKTERVAQLIRLQRTDEMEAEPRLRRFESRIFVLRLLDPVLAEDELPLTQRRRDGLRRMGLRHRHQRDRRRIAPGRRAGRGDAGANRLEGGGDGRSVRHRRAGPFGGPAAGG